MPPLPPQRPSGMGQRCDKKASSGNCRCGRGLCKPCLPVCRASAWTCRHHEYRVGGTMGRVEPVMQPQEPQACSSLRGGPW